MSVHLFVLHSFVSLPHSDAVPVPRGFFGAGVGRIHLDDLGCDGTEETLFNCSHRGIGINNCIHSEDAGVICQGR